MSIDSLSRRVSIGHAGRVTIPDDVREHLSLAPGRSLELTIEGGALVLTHSRRGRRIIKVDGWPVIEPARGMTVTDADLQRWRDGGQR